MQHSVREQSHAARIPANPRPYRIMHVTESRILNGLNESQKRAVTTITGPMMIVAGPGTGKTLTIVRRIAYLICLGIQPEHILAVTFTNRAAREMRERTEKLLSEQANNIFIGTVHLLGLAVLREAQLNDFTLFDRGEQAGVLKEALTCSLPQARQTAERISRVKNFVDTADQELAAAITTYQAAMEERSALDFDDLILKPLEVLSDAGLSEKFRERFRYLIVDEYQDINPAQYRLLRRLSGEEGNICAVGDADQAIYTFRGADVRNFLEFEKEYAGARRIVLTDHYRSTGTIVHAADALIKKNKKRIDRDIVSLRERGHPITIVSVPDERAEADVIIQEIDARMGGTSHYQLLTRSAAKDFTDHASCFSDFAVIFRTNAQVRALEEAFAESGIPYQIIGRKSTAQRRGIEEMLAYLNEIINTYSPDGAGSGSSNEAKLLHPDDYFDPRANAVTLLTLHAAKGLEFKTVFIAGVEDGLIPFRGNREQYDLEEERRLFYVGMTRAKNELFLIQARNRFYYGERLVQPRSPYLAEIPGEDTTRIVVADRNRKQKKTEEQMGLF